MKSTNGRDGYLLTWAPDHPLAYKSGYVLEHRKEKLLEGVIHAAVYAPDSAEERDR